MLALGRNVGQSIIINDNITVQVVRVKGDQVTLGIQAPKEVPVHRSEVQQRIKELENAGNTSSV